MASHTAGRAKRSSRATGTRSPKLPTILQRRPPLRSRPAAARARRAPSRWATRLQRASRRRVRVRSVRVARSRRRTCRRGCTFSSARPAGRCVRSARALLCSALLFSSLLTDKSYHITRPLKRDLFAFGMDLVRHVALNALPQAICFVCCVEQPYFDRYSR